MAAEYATRPWNHRPVFDTNVGSATDLIAAGIATQALVISNEDATNAIRLRFDGLDATATTGILLKAGQSIYFAGGEVPNGKVSAYADAAVAVSVAYIQ